MRVVREQSPDDAPCGKTLPGLLPDWGRVLPGRRATTDSFIRMTDVPEEAHLETDALLEYVREKGGDDLADYLELLYEDYYNDDLTDSGRYFRVKKLASDDISSLIDIAVLFGMTWEREDPWGAGADGYECVYCDEPLDGSTEAVEHHDKVHPDRRFDPIWYSDGTGVEDEHD